MYSLYTFCILDSAMLMFIHLKQSIALGKSQKYRTLQGKKLVFMHSAITPPKVNRFGAL